MPRVLVIVEGLTEERFVTRVLAPALGEHQVALYAKNLEGKLGYARVRAILVKLLRQEQNHSDSFVTTMFDLYRLPPDYPGYQDSTLARDAYGRVGLMEDRLRADLAQNRFIPYLQLHEFEALLLTRVQSLAALYPAATKELTQLEADVREEIRQQGFTSPEQINDRPEKSPSKRIIAAVPDYGKRKAEVGPIVAASIGLPTLRASCPHFNAWLKQLEALGAR